jgi:hypothetical protein
MNKRLEFLQRRNKGKQRIEQYEAILVNSGFNKLELEFIELEESDKIIEQLKSKFTNIHRETELLGNESLFIDSDLMRAIYLNLDKNVTCYIYTDDFQYCGMFVVNAKRGFEIAFNVAKNDSQNTCFLLDMDLKYSFLIDYNDENDSSDPNTFDIQLWKSPE